MRYRGYEIIVDTDFCGEKITYVELPGGPVDVENIKSAKALIDSMIRDVREFNCDASEL